MTRIIASTAPIHAPGGVRTLAQLKPGECGMVHRVTGSGAIHRRILDMGISRGTLILMEREAPLRDPIKIHVRGYALSLRKSEARLIELVAALDTSIPTLDAESSAA